MIRTARFWLLAAAVALLVAPASASAQYGRPTTEPTTVEIAVALLDLERIDDATQGNSARAFYVAILGERLLRRPVERPPAGPRRSRGRPA